MLKKNVVNVIKVQKVVEYRDIIVAVFRYFFVGDVWGGGSADVLWGEKCQNGEGGKGVNVIERLRKNDTDPYGSGSATLEVINKHFARREKGSE